MTQPTQHTETRTPPSALEIEEAVLGSCLIDREALEAAMSRCTQKHFYHPRNRHIWDALSHQFDNSASVDMISVEQYLKDKNQLDEIGGPGYLADLTRSVSSSAHIDYHVQILEEKKLKREFILSFSDLVKKGYDTAADSYDLLNEAAAAIDKLSDGAIMRNGRPIAEGLPASLEWIHERRAHPDTITGVPTGLDVDDFTGGWQNGDLVIVAARPSMGKTAFVLTGARNAALQAQPCPGAIFSLEMDEKSLINRFVCMEAKIDYADLRAGRISEIQLEKISGPIAERLYKAPVIIDDSPALSLRSLKTKARKYKRRYGIRWLVVDYLQLMDLGSGKQTTDEKIGAVTRGLKLIAKELDIPVILLSQLSRDVERRGGSKRPMLSDLRSSGNIEQDADVVAFLYRPEYYDIKITADGATTEGLAEAIISKQRNGPIGTAHLNFAKQFGEFRNQSYTHEDSSGKAPF